MFVAQDVGIVGGRDVIDGTGPGDALFMGTFGRWGRLVGNHHLGVGSLRDVDVVKGVNMAVRAEALIVPMGFRGDGAQPHREVAMCLEAAKRGWRVVYDPAIKVQYYPADRARVDERGRADAGVIFNESFNCHIALAGTQPALDGSARVRGSRRHDAQPRSRQVCPRDRPTWIRHLAAVHSCSAGSTCGAQRGHQGRAEHLEHGIRVTSARA